MINYKLLQDSVDYYSEWFAPIEAPWLVTKDIAYITTPPEVHMHHVIKNGKEKVFVGSGEQSFLYLINKGFLPSGKYQTITPCMRNDDFDMYHTKYFLKNELIFFDFTSNWNKNSAYVKDNLHQIINTAMSFFDRYVPKTELLKKVQTDIGYDIEYNGIELGSYGIRSNKLVTWINGTGLAEPRFSRAIL
jgi:hypothetical protein